MHTITNVTSTLSGGVSQPIPSHLLVQDQALKIDPANQLGFGMGRIVRAAFDHLLSSWEKMWVREPSSEELTMRKQIMIFRQGLRECTEKLDQALDQMQKNPRDPGIVKNFRSLALHYQVYLKPHEQKELQNYQQKIFKPLTEKISRIAYLPIQNALKEFAPILFKEKYPAIVKEHSLAPKRSLQQSGGIPSSFDLTTLDGRNGFKVEGLAANDFLGAVSTAGDFNGDGIADLILGAYGADPGGLGNYTGTAYVLFGQASGWTGAFNLTSLNGTNGFKIEGLAAGDYLGYSVSTAGDLNGDGTVDLVLGAYRAAAGGRTQAGTTYVLFGQTSGWFPSFNLATLNGTNGFKVDGLAMGDRLGNSVSTSGDLNGDGIADFVLGASYADPGGLSLAGTAYVIFGKANSWPGAFNLTTLNGTNGFKIDGLVAGDQLGNSVSTTGDLNGDGKADLVLGANWASPGANPGFRSFAGTVYVLFGQVSGWPGAFNLTTLNGTNGFKVEGLAALDYLGNSVSTAGDLNGDGKADLVLGAPYASPSGRTNAGTAYVLFGQAAGWQAAFNLTSLNGTNGFKIEGLISLDTLGNSVSTAEDFNGDGITDLVLGAYGASPGGRTAAGAVYVLFGQASGWPSAFNLTSLNGTNGFKIDGLAADDHLGYSVSAAGDFNGDGKADLVLGSRSINPGRPNSAGTVYVIFEANATLPNLPSSTIASTQFSSSLNQNPTASSSSLPSSAPIDDSVVIPPTTDVQTIGIAAGIGGLAILGAVAGIVAFLWRKKKACFEKNAAFSTPSSHDDLEQDSRSSSLELAHSLFISTQEIEIVKKIAEGNFGDVYKGIYQERAVAIKQLKGQLSSKSQEKLFQEVKIISQLRSPFIVGFYGVTKEQPYRIVMQYMEGGSLRDFLKSRSPKETPWNLRLQMGQDIGQGLKYLHGGNIVHGDLKSLNVLLDKEQHALLADFGLASVKTENMEQYYQDTAKAKGSLLWMAPELFGQSRHTFATDVYSLGGVLWEIATHRLPFQEFNWKVPELIAQISKGTREIFPEDTPDEYQTLAMRCWDGDPKARPNATDAAKILTALWKREGGIDDNEMEVIAVDSPYLTGAVASPYEGKSSYDQAQTKFGI